MSRSILVDTAGLVSTAQRMRPYAGLLVAAVAFLVYANSLGNGFVSDDVNVILTNPVMQGRPLDVFDSVDGGRDFDVLPYYRPMTALLFLADNRLHGFNPFLMHLVNVLLHVANAYLVYLLAWEYLEHNGAALLAGLLFAVHPVNTEAVDFINARNVLLSSLFVLSAYLVHRRSVRGGSMWSAIVGAILFLGGMLTKEPALMVLPLIIALELPSFRTGNSPAMIRSTLRLLPYGVAATVYLALRWAVLSKRGIQLGILPGLGSQQLHSLLKIPDLGTRLIDNLFIIPRYALTLIRPTALSIWYVVPEDLLSIAPMLVAAWACILASLAWLLIRRRNTTTIFGLLWLFLFWLPVSGLIAFPSAPLADRYLYAPAIGLWIIAADQIRVWWTDYGRVRRAGMIAGIVVLCILAVLTMQRNLDWKDDMTLYRRFVEQYPDNPFAHAGLGEAYYKKDKKDPVGLNMAEKEFELALAQKPHLPDIHTMLGNIRLTMQDGEAAYRYYTIALGEFPLDKEARLNRAITLELLGRNNEALEDFRAFLTIPGYELDDARPYARERVEYLTRSDGR